MTLLELDRLSKHFGKVRAADEVSFDIRYGEIFGFIGPNGSGKSTTIRMLIGAIRPTAGDIRFEGESIKKDKNYIEDISYVPGDVNLWGNLTGLEVINFFMKMRGFKDTAKRDALIRRFQLDEKKKCKTYSKGNRQKVALISALMSDARLLIFDEPTTGLDPLMERVFHEEVLKCRDEGRSVLLSSHILSEVEKLADRIAIIRQGRIIESGDFDALKHITRVEYNIETDDDLTALESAGYVHEFKKSGGSYHILVDRDKVPALLNTLRRYDLKGLTTTPPKLEDIFMRYYEDGS